MLLKHILDWMQEFLYFWQMYDVIVRLSYSYILTVWQYVHMFKKDETRLFLNAIWEKCKWKVQMFILVTLWQLLPCHFNAWCVAKAMEYVGLTYLPLLCNPLSYYIFWLLMYIVCNWASTCTIHKDSEVLQKD